MSDDERKKFLIGMVTDRNTNSAMASALFDFKCIKDQMVIDFLFDINAFIICVCLISADLIKQG